MATELKTLERARENVERARDRLDHETNPLMRAAYANQLQVAVRCLSALEEINNRAVKLSL